MVDPTNSESNPSGSLPINRSNEQIESKQKIDIQKKPDHELKTAEVGKRLFSQISDRDDIDATQLKEKKDIQLSPKGGKIAKFLKSTDSALRLEEDKKAIQDLFQKLLSEMEREGQSVIKLSKKKYTQLSSSYYVTKEGEIFRHIHRRDREDKGFIGEGGTKQVYDVESVGTVSSSEKQVDYVRARAKSESLTDVDRLKRMTSKLKELKHVAIGLYHTYKSEKTGQTRHLWLVPKLSTNLEEYFLDKGRDRRVSLEAILSAAKGLAELHSEGWSHQDIKSDNFLVRVDEEGNIAEVFLTDFDFAVDEEVLRARKEKYGREIESTEEKPREFDNLEDEQAWESFSSGIETIDDAQTSDIYNLGLALYEIHLGRYIGVEDELQGVEIDPQDKDYELKKLFQEMMSDSPAERPKAEKVVARLEEIKRKNG